MIKKLTAISTLFLLVGCQSLGSSKILYKLSDEDTKKWVTEINKMEQCLFAKEYTTQNFNNLSNEERLLLNNAKYNLLAQIIKPGYVHFIKTDLSSQQYAISQFQKFNHSDKANFDAKWCETQKQSYKQALKQVRNEIKKQKVEEIARQKEAQKKQAEAERKRKELEAYYRTPAGQMELARQQMARQHQEMMAQQQAMYRQQQAMIAAQAKAAKDRDMDNWMNSMSQGFSTPNYVPNYQLQNINRSLNQINSTLEGMTPRQPGIGPRWNNVY